MPATLTTNVLTSSGTLSVHSVRKLSSPPCTAHIRPVPIFSPSRALTSAYQLRTSSYSSLSLASSARNQRSSAVVGSRKRFVCEAATADPRKTWTLLKRKTSLREADVMEQLVPGQTLTQVRSVQTGATPKRADSAPSGGPLVAPPPGNTSSGSSAEKRVQATAGLPGVLPPGGAARGSPEEGAALPWVGRHVSGALLATCGVLVLLALPEAAALADSSWGVSAGGGVFAGAPADDDYIYTTKDLAVDLVSPLVAYKVVTLALRQKLNPALDASIAVATAAALWVCFSDNTALDAYLA